MRKNTKLLTDPILTSLNNETLTDKILSRQQTMDPKHFRKTMAHIRNHKGYMKPSTSRQEAMLIMNRLQVTFQLDFLRREKPGTLGKDIMADTFNGSALDINYGVPIGDKQHPAILNSMFMVGNALGMCMDGEKTPAEIAEIFAQCNIPDTQEGAVARETVRRLRRDYRSYWFQAVYEMSGWARRDDLKEAQDERAKEFARQTKARENNPGAAAPAGDLVHATLSMAHVNTVIFDGLRDTLDWRNWGRLMTLERSSGMTLRRWWRTIVDEQ